MEITSTNPLYDVLIIGAGPSGLTAAIYTARADLSTKVIAGNPSGGQLMLTSEVENFPGFPEGIQGPELIASMRKQAVRFNVNLSDENVVELTGDVKTSFKITTDQNNVYHSKTIIIASGADSRWLGLESEQRLRGKGVTACATCDAFFFKNKVVAVVGGGDSAMEESLFLTKFASKVYILARGDVNTLRASKIMQKRALEHPKIEFKYNVEVKEVLGENSVSGLRLYNSKETKEEILEVQGLFLAIGHIPNTKFLHEFIDIGKGGYALVTEGTRSSKEGVFVAGDVYDYKYRQAITAAGYGCMAALEVERYLSEHN